MLEIVTAGGWLMIPILLCSVIALAISIERLVALKANKVAPPQLVQTLFQQIKAGQLNADKLRALRSSSHLGHILAAGLVNAKAGRDVMKESVRDAGGQVVHELERFLNTLGTVIGMISVFTEIVTQGTGNAGALAGGISQALITTAAGLTVAIPSLVMHRYLHGRVDAIVVRMEQDANRLIEALHGNAGAMTETEAPK
jgi:biopolymer transport protein ExbB